MYIDSQILISAAEVGENSGASQKTPMNHFKNALLNLRV
jgi:hypothetical protein